MNTNKDVFDEMAVAWRAPIVARSEVGRFSGGIITHKTLKNLDGQGKGPKSMHLGRKRVYRVDELVPWLREWATR